MPTLVDSLVVTLGLDASGFQQGSATVGDTLKVTRDQADKTAKELAVRGKQASEFFTSIKNEALSLMGVLLGGRGLEEFISHAVTGLSAMGREAKNIGIAVPDLAAFRNMIERNGGSADAAAQSLRNLTDQVEKFQVGQASPEFAGAMGLIGGRLTDSPIEVFKKFAKFTETHSVQLSNLIGQRLGLDQGTINEALKGLNQVQKDLAKSFEIGVPTGPMTEHMQRLQEAWVSFRQAMDNVANVVLDKVEPVFSWLLDWAVKMVEKYPEVAEVITAGTTVIGGLIALGITARIASATASFLSLGSAIGTVAAAMGGVIAFASGFAAGLAVLAGIADIWEHFGLNQGEAEQLNKWRVEHGMAPLPPGGAGKPTGLKPDQVINDPRENPTHDMAPPEGQALLDTIAVGESSGRYDVRYSPTGDKTFNGFADHPRVFEPTTGGQFSSAAGKYQFTATTWDDIQKTLHLPDFSPRSQEIAGWYLAQRTYHEHGGGDLASDIRAARGNPRALAAIAQRMSHEWTSAPGGAEPNAATGGFVTEFARRLAAVPEAGPPLPSSGPPPRPQTVTPDVRAPADPSLAPTPRARLQAPAPLAASPESAAAGAAAPSTTINHITVGDVHTQATDARGIASDLHGALNDALITQANRGLA